MSGPPFEHRASLFRRLVRRTLRPETRRHFGAKLEHWIQRIREVGARLAGVPLAAALRLLPLGVLAVLKERLHVSGKLDDPRSDIRLSIESTIELSMRLHACRKEPETIAWIEQSIRPGDIVFDVGANVGAYSLVIDRRCGGRCKVYAFEPSFATFAQLNRNVLLNGCEGRVIPVPVALSDATSLRDFSYRSLLAGTALHALAAPDASWAVRRQPVLACRMDDFIAGNGVPVPNHVKLDVDGGEPAVLDGAARTLRDPALRTIMLEVDPQSVDADALQSRLLVCGFRLHSTHPHGVGPLATRNVVFRRDA